METLEKDWLGFENVTLAYESKQVTPEPLSFSVSHPGICVLLGKNGAGKSSVLKAVLGEPVCSKGTVSLFGAPARDCTRIAYVPQDPVYPAHLKMEDALAIAFLPEIGWWGKRLSEHTDRMEEAILQFGLGEMRGRRLGALTPGERQRTFLARALLQNPRVCLLDEPTNHLDPEARYFFWAALQGAVSVSGTRVLVSTHDLDFARGKASWICAFSQGRLVFHDRGSAFWNLDHIAAVFGEGPAREWIKVNHS